jgi:outer membrane protein OmpA-like peptidoglycan-associated protein/Mg-chelatase subunit ChlD
MKKMFLLLITLLVSTVAFAAGEPNLKISVAKPGATVTVDRVIKDGRLLVIVDDAAKKPLLGLTAADFSVAQTGRTAKITSVQPMSENLDVPRHIVLVLDNSYSMYERKAIKALLSGVDELLKTVRPIDDVQMIVFDNKKTVNVGGRQLHVQTFSSNQPAELKAFATKAYQTEGLTGGTVLYEALLAGLDSIGKMPDSEPRFLVVFSDGEDLNSTVKSDVVFKATKELKRFNIYAIDYLEAPAPGKFLSKLAAQNGGQVFKAKSETNLVPIFQSVASKMQYYYVVNYQFVPTGKLTVAPTSLMVDQVSALPAAPITRISTPALTLRPVLDSAYGIARWKSIISNAKGVVAELAGEGTPAAELQIPLPTMDIASLAANGNLAVKMELEDNRGQTMALSSPEITVKLVQTRASLAVAPTTLNIEEIKTIDVSPMLGYIFFDKVSGVIPARYVQFSAAGETTGFDEQKFSGTLDKYYQDLNIIGKRLADKPDATITLTGCNDNSGKEKANKKLSTQRAENVKKYLQTVWNISPERMSIESRNLPAKPSSIQLKEGQAENRRVEISSTDPAILAPIRSTYITTRIDASTLKLRPEVVAPYGVASWKVTVANTSATLASQTGKGSPAKEISIPVETKDLKALGTAGDITVKMELQDGKGQNLALSPDPIKVNFIQTSQRLAQKEGQLIQEKYALILFDFNKDTIGTQNQDIVNRIVARIKTLPQAKVEIVGHTDNIGSEKYNQKLSERRALAVNKLLAAAYGETAADRIRYSGVGPNSPLFDNLSPEARSFNRTVTITLEYQSKE